MFNSRTTIENLVKKRGKFRNHSIFFPPAMAIQRTVLIPNKASKIRVSRGAGNNGSLQIEWDDRCNVTAVSSSREVPPTPPLFPLPRSTAELVPIYSGVTSI